MDDDNLIKFSICWHANICNVAGMIFDDGRVRVFSEKPGEYLEFPAPAAEIFERMKAREAARR